MHWSIETRPMKILSNIMLYMAIYYDVTLNIWTEFVGCAELKPAHKQNTGK